MALQEVGLYETSGRDSTSTPSNNQVLINTDSKCPIGNSVLMYWSKFTFENTLDFGRD